MPELADDAARDRIERDLTGTLFVEAGAGSGKTTALVARVVALVTSGVAELREIAAITFTEKAGAELRDRIRRKLQERASADPDPEVVQRCRTALDQLDGAAIGTLHSFAHRLLSEHPIEAGLPPRVEVLDEVSSGVEFERRWSAFRDDMLDDRDLERTLLLLLTTGVGPAALDTLALRVRAELGPRRGTRAGGRAGAAVGVRRSSPARSTRSTTCARHASTARPPTTSCASGSTKSPTTSCSCGPSTTNTSCSTRSVRRRRRSAPSFNVTIGQQGNWPDVGDVRARASERPARNSTACTRRSVMRARTGSVPRSDGSRCRLRPSGVRKAGSSSTICSCSRASLLRDPEVRVRRLHARYSRLLLDEFQDTDPIQIELAVRIAAADPSDPASGSAPWTDVPVAAGQLFVVGDPKQSIYRFRRADISTFLTARARFGVDTGDLVELVSNFRSAAPVIDWVNDVFGTLIDESERLRDPGAVAARLRRARARPATHRRSGLAVAVIGRGEHAPKASADEQREAGGRRGGSSDRARDRRGLDRRRRQGRVASGPARRHHHPHPRRAPRCRSCRRRSTA